MSYYPDSVRYPDGPDWEVPDFTGHCPKCGGFLSSEAAQPEMQLGVWRYSPEWGNAPDNPTEDERAEWQALRDEISRLRLLGGNYERILEIEKRLRRDFIEEWPEPYWKCRRCGHEATYSEVYH